MIPRTNHKVRIVGLPAVLLLLAWASAAQAQEPPSLRAAPPPEPDVLTAGPNASAVAQENRDIAGRWIGSFDAAVQSLGKAGGPLTNIVTGKFGGLSKTIAIADWAAPLGAASALDVRGAVSGAAAITVGGGVTAGGAALFGEIGAVAGGAIGSFFPVIGTIAGSVVGGAVGTAAGGFIAAFSYDKYVKDYVAKGVTGIVSVFDKAPLAEAMEAKRAFLWDTMAPEERAQLQGFRPEEVTLLDFGTLPYVPVLKQPAPQMPALDAQQQAALPPMTHFEIDAGLAVDDCRLSGDQVNCVRRWQSLPLGVISNRTVITGRLSGNTMAGTETIQITHYYSGSRCTGTDTATGPITFTFDAGGTAKIKSGPYRVMHSGCSSAAIWPSGEATVQWRVLE